MKQILLIMLLACCQRVIAENVMSVIADNGRAIPLSQVQCLIASDDDSTMTIMLNDGQTLDGIDYVTFGLVDDTSIKTIESKRKILIVNEQIIITGVALGSYITVSDIYGKMLIGTTVESEPCIINATSLAPNLCYIISVNGISTKIMKR